MIQAGSGETTINIGIDVVDIDRIKSILEKRPRFAERYFHPEELKALRAKKDFSRHLAGRFAAKEAVVKALGTGFSGFSLKDVVILNDENGRPFVRLEGKALRKCTELGIKEIVLSISFSKKTAVASAVAIKRNEQGS